MKFIHPLIVTAVSASFSCPLAALCAQADAVSSPSSSSTSPAQRTTAEPSREAQPLSPMTVSGTPGHRKPMVLEGSAEVSVENDPSEKPILIEWDQWRNDMVRAAWTNWGNLLDGPGVSLGSLKMNLGAIRRHRTAFAEGTAATFQCRVTSDRHIENLRILESSGDGDFDAMVLKSVRMLDGKSVLTFPKDSHRESIEETCKFRIGKTAFRDQRFDDVEHANL